MKRTRELVACAVMAAALVPAHAQKMTDMVRDQMREEAARPAYQIQEEKNRALYKQAKDLLKAGNFQAGIPLLKQAADGGLNDAKLDLAILYEEGEGVPVSLATAQRYYVEVAKGWNDPSLQVQVAKMYCGEGLYTADQVQVDPQKGLEHLRSAKYTRQWDAQVDWWTYVCLSNLGDSVKAKEVLKGLNSGYGRKGEADTKQNQIAWEKARAEVWTCSPYVQSSGPCLEFALHDKEGAIKKYQSQADAGDVKAQSALYEAYSDGRGAPQSRTRAFEWIKQAAEAGSASAQTIVGEAYLKGYMPVAKDVRLAAEWLRKGAEGGEWMAAYFLASVYKDGQLGKVDQRQAKAWMDRCVEMGGRSPWCKADQKAVTSGTALQKAFQQ